MDDSSRARSSDDPRSTLVWPLRLTWLGLLAERMVRAFWPLWTLALAVLAVANATGWLWNVCDTMQSPLSDAGCAAAYRRIPGSTGPGATGGPPPADRMPSRSAR